MLGRLRYLLVPAAAAVLVLAGPGPDALPARIALLKKLGVGIVRYNLQWSVIAANRPALGSDRDDPAYDWTASDTVLDALHVANIPVLLTVNGTPTWANAGRAPSSAPSSASLFTDFV